MKWQEFRELNSMYELALCKREYKKDLELNQQIYEGVFQKYLKLPRGEQKQVLQNTLNILGETALTIEELLLKEAENQNT